MALQSSKIISIKEYLGNTLFIPQYQREYAWEEPELDDFWVDLKTTMSEKDVHFFGQIVIHNDHETNKLYVIDGQQRTITSVIFLRVLQKIYSEHDIIKDTEDAKEIVNDIASLIGRKTRNHNTLHLVLGNEDQEYFINNIQSGYPEADKKEKKKSQERMRKAFFYFENHIKEMIEGLTDEYDILDILENVYSVFSKQFQVLYMEATKLNEAFIIFETLNARGKDLETADLLKNYIFSKSNDVKVAEKQWNEMISDLDGIDPTKYIRYLWNSGHDFSREKELYKRIVRSIDTPKRSKEFLSEISTYAPIYHDLSSPSDCNYFADKRLIDSLLVLKNLKATTFYPVVIALTTQDYSESDIADVVNTIETYIFRNISIGGKTANSTETFFSKLAKNISDLVITSKEDIQDTIKKLMIDDEEFKNLFSRWKGSNSAVDKFIVRYIFRNIHSLLSATSEVVLDNNKVHIEHIMPQNGTLWTDISEEVHDEYLWRLGNLALLDADLNKEMQNKPFKDKKGFFAQSQIKPNDEIANLSSWGSKEIENRQASLAELALKIWK